MYSHVIQNSAFCKRTLNKKLGKVAACPKIGQSFPLNNLHTVPLYSTYLSIKYWSRKLGHHIVPSKKEKKNHTSALILKTTKITGWLTASAYDLCMRKLLSAAACAHQSRSRDPCVVGRISRKLWRGRLHLCWPAASHKKYFSSRWLYAELSGLQENESYLNMSTALLEKNTGIRISWQG